MLPYASIILSNSSTSELRDEYRERHIKTDQINPLTLRDNEHGSHTTRNRSISTKTNCQLMTTVGDASAGISSSPVTNRKLPRPLTTGESRRPADKRVRGRVERDHVGAGCQSADYSVRLAAYTGHDARPPCVLPLPLTADAQWPTCGATHIQTSLTHTERMPPALHTPVSQANSASYPHRLTHCSLSSFIMPRSTHNRSMRRCNVHNAYSV